jgi:hypothetical protein
MKLIKLPSLLCLLQCGICITTNDGYIIIIIIIIRVIKS